jgi:serine protease Do
MKAPLQAAILIALTSAATTAVVLPVATAQQSEQSTAPAPVVVGLPDFTQLVEQVGPGVVNVVAEIGTKPAKRSERAAQQMPDDEDMPEFFRHIFGPDMPFPGMPGQGGNGPRERGTSMGSGFIISADGYVLTNHHVIDHADTVNVKLSDGREFPAKVVGSDEQSDVALLKIAASDLPVLRIGDSNTLKPGQWAVAIGSPFGLDHSVTAGIISAIGRSAPQLTGQKYVPFIQTDVAINQGNSGGPLLNTRGEVVGINSQIFSNSGGYMGVSFAIPIDTAMNAVKQLKAGGKVKYGMLGAQFQLQISTNEAKGLHLPDTKGALITSIVEGSGAEKAGLQPGDVIRTVNGTPIAQYSDLPPMIGAMPPGAHVELGILRSGQQRKIDVTLTEYSEDALAGGGQDQDEEGTQGPHSPAMKRGNALGVIGQDLDADDRSQAGLKPGEGVGIARVDGMAAHEAQLQPGQIVLRVGNTPVGSAAALDRALAGVKPGQTTMLLIRDGQGTRFVAITPQAGDQDDE